MVILKCKMCGGDLHIIEGQTVCECEYCGTKQTLPRIDSDRKLSLYDRANHFRRNNEFDKASAIYEQVLSEDNNDAEAYWSLVLCRYGIEYVEDPVSHKRIPTVNRAQYTSIFNDEDYKKALELATVDQKIIYEEEAKAIDDIQKGILEVSSKEEPFDVFICYKETDNSGRRTMDSVLAQDIYKELTNEGYKVFFSRITLEDKLGTAYEPYIFAALHSAKVMIVVGTKPENFNAVWVKNEWSRYIALINKGEKKTLIPAYRDMDPYDLPEEFAYLQAQDMSKLGFMQDLTRGVKKIIDADKKTVKETVVINNQADPSVNPLLERIQIFLEDGDFKAADEYCDRVLDIDPKNGEAYLYKLLVEKNVKNTDELIRYYEQYFKSDNYETKTAVEEDTDHINDIVRRFSIKNYLGEEEIKSEYQYDRTYSSLLQNKINQKQHIQKELENDRYYTRSVNYGNENAKKTFDVIIREYDQRIEQARQSDEEKINDITTRYKAFLGEADQVTEELYESAANKKENDYQSYISEVNQINSVKQAELLISELTILGGYKESEKYIETCRTKAEELNAVDKKNKEIAAKKKKKNAIITGVILVLVIVLAVLYITVIVPKKNYDKALTYYENGDYVSALPLFSKLGNYQDSEKYAYKSEQLKCEAGDIIRLGSYEQDNNTSNGKEEIEWIILEKDEDKLYVISKYILDYKPFNEKFTNVTWETSTLREWLNDSFYLSSFNENEKEMILKTKYKAESNDVYPSTDIGNDTFDNISLLSYSEANKYFTSDSKRCCDPTEYAVKQNVYDRYKDDYKKGSAAWGLRTSAGVQWALIVEGIEFPTGAFHNTFEIKKQGEFGSSDIDFGTGVRPTIWIDYNAIKNSILSEE